jgi:serine/threonine-protein kinase
MAEAERGGAVPPASWLLWLSALALASLGWSIYLWLSLNDVRTGGEAACLIGSPAACATLWTSGFAQSIESATRLPIAAWGVLWSAVALGLAAGAVALRKRAGVARLLWSGTVWMAGGGLAGIATLAVVSLQYGSVCSSCVVTYLIVGAFAALALVAAGRHERLAIANGGLCVLTASAAVYLVLLYPASRSEAGGSLPKAAAPAPVASPDPLETPAPPLTPELRAERLTRLMASLRLEQRQLLSDSLEVYRRAEPREMRPPRGLVGDPASSVRVTEFAEMLCGHCAQFHEVAAKLFRVLGKDAFALEPRYFPLDRRCNPTGPPAPEGAPQTSCVAAKVMVCAAGHPAAFQLSGTLFANQRTLTEDKALRVADQLLLGVPVRECAESEATAEALRGDVEWATEHGITGTPLVLVNGRQLEAWSELSLYALILAEGNPDHPAFASLPPPRRGRSE